MTPANSTGMLLFHPSLPILLPAVFAVTLCRIPDRIHSLGINRGTRRRLQSPPAASLFSAAETGAKMRMYASWQGGFIWMTNSLR